MPMKSNWIHCRAFGFSEQTHHFLKSGSLCHPGLRGSWPCLVPITYLPGRVEPVLWLLMGASRKESAWPLSVGWPDFLRFPGKVVDSDCPVEQLPPSLPAKKMLASFIPSPQVLSLQFSFCPMPPLVQSKVSLPTVQILSSVSHFSWEQR